MEIQTMRNRLPGNVMRLCIDAGHAYDVSGRLYSKQNDRYLPALCKHGRTAAEDGCTAG